MKQIGNNLLIDSIYESSCIMEGASMEGAVREDKDHWF